MPPPPTPKRIVCVSNLPIQEIEERQHGTAVYVGRLIEIAQSLGKVTLVAPTFAVERRAEWQNAIVREYHAEGVPSFARRSLLSLKLGMKPAWWRWYSAEAVAFLSSLSRNTCDALFFLTEATTVLWVPTSLPTYLFRHNIDALSLRQVRISDGVKSWLRSRYHAALMDRFDVHTCHTFTHVLANNTDDCKYLKKKSGRINISTLATTIDDPNPKSRIAFRPRDNADSIQLIFVGNFAYEPNRQGVDWFLKHVWPLLDKQLRRRLIVEFVGSGGENLSNQFDIPVDGNIRFRGFVDDLSQCFFESDIAMVPVLRGSGVKIKTLTSLAHGIPLVSSKCGIEGLGAYVDNRILIADSAVGFANAIETLASDVPRQQYARSARKAFESYQAANNPSVGLQQKLEFEAS